MKNLWFCIIFYLINGRSNKSAAQIDPGRPCNDSYNDEKVLANVLETFSSGMKSMVNEFEKLNQNIENLNKRFDELSKKQDALEHLIRNSFNSSEKWTTILRRQDGSVEFYLDWNDYKKGFGDPEGEFFIGLEKLHILTTYGAPQELLVLVKDFENISRYAKYDLFQVAGEGEKYAIKKLGIYSGNAGDSLMTHKGKRFSTFDQDNDTDKANCAKFYRGAWWFHTCFDSHLFGPYRLKHESNKWGLAWTSWKGWSEHSIQYAEVMIRARL